MCLEDGTADSIDGDGRAAATPELVVEDVLRDGERTLVLAGELDLATRPLFDAALSRVARERPARLILDLSEVAFMDSTGLHGVLTAKAMCAASDCELLLMRGSTQVQRLFELSGVLDELAFRAQAA